LKRGEIWTVAGGGGFAGKPRPVIIVQDDRFDATPSITICPLTSDPTEAPLFRPILEPSPTNGLLRRSWMEVDKVTTTWKRNLERQIGRLDGDAIVEFNRALVVFLGLAG
jgi:mRNA interferase MazF